MKAMLLLLFASRIAFAQSAGYKAEADQNLAFFQAAKVGDLALLERKLASTPVNTQDSQGYTALIYAAYYGESEAVNYLLKKGADPCLADKRGNTATMAAIFKGNFRVLKSLIKAKCAVEQPNSAEQTPLMFASLFGRKDMAKELIRNGANVKAKDALGNDAKGLAEGQGNEDMLKILEDSR